MTKELASTFSDAKKRKRTGTIYFETTNKGRSSRRIGPRGVGGIVYTSRWVGEIMVNGRRYRKRSTNLDNVKFWLENMVSLYPYY